MTLSSFIECNDCGEKYRIRYGLGNNYPQIASFQCYECSILIEVGYEKFNGDRILRGAKSINNDNLYNEDIRVQNLHPEIPTHKENENNPYHFQTTEVFANLFRNKEDIGKFQEEQVVWSQFNNFWRDVEKPLRIVSQKDEIKLKEICGINFNQLTQKFNSWATIFIRGKQSCDFDKICDEYNSIDKTEIKNYVKNEKKFLKKINDLCNSYMKESQQFQSTIFHQKFGWELNDEMFSNINWSSIEKIYGDLYETVGDFFVIPTMINNVKCGRRFDQFNSVGFTLNDYLKTDKANRSKNFENNENLEFLSNAYHSWLRNGTFHKNSFLNTETKKIDLGTSKGGSEEKNISVVDYIKNCNELFGVGIILSSLILEMKK